MGVFDLKNTESGISQTSDTGVVDDSKTLANNDVSGAPKINETKDKTTIVLDGPLSAIYTKALNTLYAQGTKESVSQESQANDVITLAGALVAKEKQDVQDLANKQNCQFIYVTDNKEIEDRSLLDAYTTVQTAIDMQCFKEISVVMECNGNIKGASATFESFLNKAKVRVFYSRESAMRHFQG
jgi:hypothetical protein